MVYISKLVSSVSTSVSLMIYWPSLGIVTLRTFALCGVNNSGNHRMQSLYTWLTTQCFTPWHLWTAAELPFSHLKPTWISPSTQNLFNSAGELMFSSCVSMFHQCLQQCLPPLATLVQISQSLCLLCCQKRIFQPCIIRRDEIFITIIFFQNTCSITDSGMN